MKAQKIFPARLEELRSIHEWIRTELCILDLEETNIRKLELALEEALVNIIVHGYQGDEGVIGVTIRKGTENTVEIELKDSAPAFNPVEKEALFNPLASLEERNLGGLGIPIIRQYVDELRYERSGELNIFTLIKKI